MSTSRAEFKNHPSITEINLSAIHENLRQIALRVHPAEIAAVVKADGYGHGAVAIAKTALQAGAKRLAVAHGFEGAALRNTGIEAPIQVMGGFSPEEIPLFANHKLEFTVSHFEQADVLAAFAIERSQRVPVHFKFDTGMGRLGFDWREATAVLDKLRKHQSFEYVGLMTHFATSEAADKSFANLQLQRFHQIIETAKAMGFSFKFTHAANSGAVLNMPEANFNLVRPGLIMYGYVPDSALAQVLPLRTALTWRTKLVQVKTLKKGETVGYGQTWRATKETKIGVIPVGYADGYRRELSNRFDVLVNGKRAPIAGRICMDMTMLNLGPDSQAKVGDESVLLGRQGDEEITVYEMCDALDTIPYEVVCGIGKRVLRIYRSGSGIK